MHLIIWTTLDADSESEVIFYIRGQYQADIGHLQFCLQKSDKHSLIIGLLWLTRLFPRPFTHGGICPPIWGGGTSAGGQSVNGGGT